MPVQGCTLPVFLREIVSPDRVVYHVMGPCTSSMSSCHPSAARGNHQRIVSSYIGIKHGKPVGNVVACRITQRSSFFVTSVEIISSLRCTKHVLCHGNRCV